MANIVEIIISGKDLSGPVLAKAKAKAEETGTGFQKVATIGAVAAVAVAGAGLKMAADFESSTTRLMTSAGETQQNIGMIRDGLLQMAGEVGFTAEELSKGMYTVESAGFHGADGLTVLKAAAQGAKAENADLKTTTDAVTTSLLDYHQGADKAALVMSQLIKGVSEGKTTLEELAGSLHSVTPLAANLHVPFADIVGALASMTAHGMSADQASQNLASTLRSLDKPTKQQANELAGLGMDAAKLADDLGTKGLTGTIKEITDAILAKMGPSGKVMLNSLNTSQRAAQDAKIAFDTLKPATQALAKEFEAGKGGTKEYAAAVKGLSEDQRVQLGQWQQLYKSTQGFNTILKSGGADVQNYTQALGLAMGTSEGMNTALMLTGENAQTVADNVKGVADAVTEEGNNVAGTKDINDTLNQQLADIKGSASSLMIQLGQLLLPVVKDIAKAFADFTRFLVDHKAAAIALGIIIGTALVTAFVAWAAAAWSAAVATIAATWPILAIIAAIGLLVAAILWVINHWHQLGDEIHKVMSAIGDFVKGRIDWIVSTWNDFVGFIKRIAKDISDAGERMWDGFVSGLKWAVNQIIDLLNWVIGKINNLLNLFNAAISTFNGAKANLSIPLIGHLASGGPGSGMTEVNEQGSEIVKLPNGAQVIPHANTMTELGRMGGGQGSAVALSIEFTGNTDSALASVIMNLFRSNKIQIRQSQIQPN